MTSRQRQPDSERVIDPRGQFAAEVRRWIMVLAAATACGWLMQGWATDEWDRMSVDLTEMIEPFIPETSGFPIHEMLSAFAGTAPLLALAIVLSLLKPRAVRRSPPPEALRWNDAGQEFFQQGQLPQAIEAFDKAVRLNPQLAVSYYNRAVAYLRQRQREEALADLDAAIEVAPGFAEAWSARGELRCQTGDFDGALSDHTTALRLAPENAQALTHRGRLWLARQDFRHAADDFSQALQLNAEQPDALRDRGHCWIRLDDPARAMADLDEAVRLDPTDGITFNNRGLARLQMHDFAGALDDLKEAIRLFPELPNPHRHLAWLYATCPDATFRNGPQAVACAMQALELANWEPVEWLAVLAAAHAEAGNSDEAIRWQKMCVELSPADNRSEREATLAEYESRRPAAFHAEPHLTA